MITERFNYEQFGKKNVDGIRKYATPDGEKLVSVTTILDRTKPQESRDALNKWKKRIGTDEAQRITTEAANVGTLMHKYLEHWIRDGEYQRGNNLIHQVASRMADTVIENISPNLTEAWGLEVPLYYPGLYAGTTDLVGKWSHNPAIMDFKQTNKPKKEEWVTDYKLQLVAYGLCHNELYGTDIQEGHIFMCSRDCEFQQFSITPDEFEYWSQEWSKRVAQYYDL